MFNQARAPQRLSNKLPSGCSHGQPQRYLDVRAGGGNPQLHRGGTPARGVVFGCRQKHSRTEDRLGVRLFHRSTRSITLTAEGALFLERCRRILGEVEAAEAELSDAAGSPRGRLRISTPQLSGLIMPALDGFMLQYPDIELDVDLSDRMVDIIEEGFDAVIRTAAARLAAGLAAPRFCGQVLVASPGYLERHGLPRILLNSFDTRVCCTSFPPAASWSRGRFSSRRRKRSRSCRNRSSPTPLKCWLFLALQDKGIAFLPISWCGMRWRAVRYRSCSTTSSTRPSRSGFCGPQAAMHRRSCVFSSITSARI